MAADHHHAFELNVYRRNRDVIGLVGGLAAVGVAPWPGTWPDGDFLKAQHTTPGMDVVIDAVLGVAPEASEAIDYRRVFKWCNRGGRHGSVLGHPFDREIIRDTLVMLVSFGLSQDGDLLVERIPVVGPKAPAWIAPPKIGSAIRVSQGACRAVVMSLLPGTPTYGPSLTRGAAS